MKRPNPYKEVYDFNAAVKVGDTVEFSEVIGMGEPVRYQTESEAEVLGEHTAVVWLKGKRGCVKLSHQSPRVRNAIRHRRGLHESRLYGCWLIASANLAHSELLQG
jgi:hypothetical protein